MKLSEYIELLSPLPRAQWIVGYTNLPLRRLDQVLPNGTVTRYCYDWEGAPPLPIATCHCYQGWVCPCDPETKTRWHIPEDLDTPVRIVHELCLQVLGIIPITVNDWSDLDPGSKRHVVEPYRSALELIDHPKDRILWMLSVILTQKGDVELGGFPQTKTKKPKGK